MALFGEIFTAEQGLSAGLVDRVVQRGNGMATAREVIARVLERGPAATQATKMLINAVEGEEVERPLEALAGMAAAGSDDLRVGIAAFRAKSKPKF